MNKVGTMLARRASSMRSVAAGWFRYLDRSLFFGWTICSHATEETRHIAFPRVLLYVTDPLASWLERETCWLVRGREMAAAEELEGRRTGLRRRGYRIRPRAYFEHPTYGVHSYVV